MDVLNDRRPYRHGAMGSKKAELPAGTASLHFEPDTHKLLANRAHKHIQMKIPTEPIGSIPRPPKLIAAIEKAGDFADSSLDPLYDGILRRNSSRNELIVTRSGEAACHRVDWPASVN